ncbi:MAG: hypothetical protein LBR43_03610 [Spiroplasmataceae bacterium]|nr:hypothetical protein [Spiroplasmataceae bacterium]
MTNQDKIKQETILNSPAPNELAVVKSNSDWPKNLIKLILLLTFIGIIIYYLFK